ncbi:MAG: DASH family cryptochrome [Glaciecola sp.]
MRHDLRVRGNQALCELVKRCDNVAVVYVLDTDNMWYQQFTSADNNQHQRQFINQALIDVKTQLAQYNIPLYCFSGSPTNIVSDLLNSHTVDYVSYERHNGLNEIRQTDALRAQKPSLGIIEGNSNYLYSLDTLPFNIENMPNVFSPFRRKVEKYAEVKALAYKQLKTSKPFVLHNTSCSEYTPFATNENKQGDYKGGETAALQRMQEYFFNTDLIAKYKETRNGLDGWDFSSRLSAFLAHGCISPLQVIEQLKSYEETRIKNDSTYWLFFELLWREFFHLQMLKHGTRFFDIKGQRESINDIPSHCQHNEKNFEQWINGDTDYPIVNACMNQLNTTGFMSNRGRQLVASCFVHELGLDWRYGAAYFEQKLIDFDVASNYGNWQYLAGVGSDPRGLRQFNLTKQTQTYDPQHTFIKAWT